VGGQASATHPGHHRRGDTPFYPETCIRGSLCAERRKPYAPVERCARHRFLVTLFTSYALPPVSLKLQGRQWTGYAQRRQEKHTIAMRAWLFVSQKTCRLIGDKVHTNMKGNCKHPAAMAYGKGTLLNILRAIARCTASTGSGFPTYGNL
jgi:hypothetical protein